MAEKPVERLAALSVDLDEVENYAAIHGLGGSLALPDSAIYERALPRIAGIFEQLRVPATFFAIGRDLEKSENAQRLRALHQAGHEIANHSYNHYYDLTRRSQAVQHDEIRKGADAIESAVGVRPVGFRAPGYTVTDALFEVLEREGVRYDSSVFACPLYYSAKIAAIGLYRARGRKSRSIIDDPRVLTAPADPYRVGVPYYRRGTHMLELPVGVTSDRTGRLPYLGTSVVMAGDLGARLLSGLMSERGLVNLVLHGMDLADAHEDGLTALIPHQPDLRRSARQKQSALTSAVRELRRRGYRFVTLAEAARSYS